MWQCDGLVCSSGWLRQLLEAIRADMQEWQGIAQYDVLALLERIQRSYQAQESRSDWAPDWGFRIRSAAWVFWGISAAQVYIHVLYGRTLQWWGHEGSESIDTQVYSDRTQPQPKSNGQNQRFYSLASCLRVAQGPDNSGDTGGWRRWCKPSEQWWLAASRHHNKTARSRLRKWGARRHWILSET